MYSQRSPIDVSKYLYVVMDSRAEYSTDDAIVMEACGHHRPRMKYLKDMWGQQSAWLCRAPVIKETEKGVEIGEFELLEMIP